MNSFAIAPMLILFVLLGLWISQLLDLMRRRDDEFPGRFDKPIWAAVILVLPILGAFIYWLSKPFHIQSPESLRRELASAKNLKTAPTDESGKAL